MFRKDLIDLLLDRPMNLHELADILDEPVRDVEDDVQHLLKSLKHDHYRAVVIAAKCRKCGFQFKQDKLHKPGKCPQCKGTWIQEPYIYIESTK